MHCKICGAIAPHEVVPYRNEGRHGDPIFDGLSVAVCEQFQSSWVINPPSNSTLARLLRRALRARRHEESRRRNRLADLG